MQYKALIGSLAFGIVALGLGGCGPTWSNTDVTLKSGKTSEQAKEQTSEQTASLPKETKKTSKSPAKILVTTGDITDRKYRVIGDIDVTVNKTTIFHPDPTKELVDKELQEKAAEVGADAVILVRYGTVGVSLFSWGSLDGKGRAVEFVEN